MNLIDVSREIVFKTARSGGKGGQNVNKVETMVEGYFDITASALLNDEQKLLIRDKLANKINADGKLLVKSQAERTQLGNKQLVLKKINTLVNQSLKTPRKRLASKPTKASKEKRLGQKKQQSQIKEGRKKVKFDD